MTASEKRTRKPLEKSNMNDIERRSMGLTERRALEARIKKFSAQIKALPLAEKFRLIADFIDTGQTGLAMQLARHATEELCKP